MNPANIDQTQKVLNLALAAYDARSLTETCFADLKTLFQAIRRASEQGSEAYRLAEIGSYLSTDLGSAVAAQVEAIDEPLSVLRTALNKAGTNP